MTDHKHEEHTTLPGVEEEHEDVIIMPPSLLNDDSHRVSHANHVQITPPTGTGSPTPRSPRGGGGGVPKSGSKNDLSSTWSPQKNSPSRHSPIPFQFNASNDLPPPITAAAITSPENPVFNTSFNNSMSPSSRKSSFVAFRRGSTATREARDPKVSQKEFVRT
jgi:hypothetical protein